MYLFYPHPLPFLCGVVGSYESPPFSQVLRFIPWHLSIRQIVPGVIIQPHALLFSTSLSRNLHHHHSFIHNGLLDIILTTNLAAVVCVCVCVCAKFDQFLPALSYFESIRPENFVRIAKFPYAAFGPLFAFHCPLFFLRETMI